MVWFNAMRNRTEHRQTVPICYALFRNSKGHGIFRHGLSPPAVGFAFGEVDN